MPELTKNQQSDKRFITTPDSGQGYSNWPYLPMKRNGEHGLEAGTIIDRNPLGEPIKDRNAECFRTVYLMSVWESSHTRKPITSAEKKVYPTVDEMLADGWQVD